MELEAIRNFVRDHPGGVRIRMVDGTEYLLPHRDWIHFGPPQILPSGKEVIRGTSFLIFETAGEGVSSMRLVNAMLVAEIFPLKNGNGAHRRRKQPKK